ncbi:MAG: DNA-formamidopyrimidine glycosylase, partial [Gammaproteobacteria bacterium]|nr:DNA-formamidopyrimidine glycosylase [Gammaproteobacteria bacterium]
MPELPEVETTRLGVRPHVIGKPIVRVLVRESRLRWPVSPELPQMLTGNIISDVARRGKYLLFLTECGRMMVHLGMSGSLRITDINKVPRKHDHIDICFVDGNILRFHDPRRFGSVLWLPGESGHELIDNLGPEPLEDDFDGDHLYRLSQSRRTAVKT